MSLTERINLGRLKKCDQIWEYMPENEEGRLCEKCDNTIIDFRNKSNQEIALIHSSDNTKVCGLYKSEQLKSPTKRSVNKKTSHWSSIYIGVFGALAINNINAQNNKTETVQIDVKKNISKINDNEVKKSIAVNDSIFIRGLITDENNTPLSGVSIFKKGTNNGIVTDFDGSYILNISKNDIEDKTLLIFNYVGYARKEIEFNKDSFSNKNIITCNIKLKEDLTSLNSFYVSYRPSLYKRRLYALKKIFSSKK